MRNASFEHAIRFYQGRTVAGVVVWLPLVTVSLVQPSGNRVALPLLFDTGASVTTLRHELYPLLGLTSWDSGQPTDVLTASGNRPVRAYRYQAKLEFLGKVVDCPIHLQEMPSHPLYMGLFGREQAFESFGFGFWENAHELYVTFYP